MKKLMVLAVLLLCGAGYLYLQTGAPPATPPLASITPGGALLYLEAPQFATLLRDWDGSKLKPAWLASANYETFARSNLFIKLTEVYSQYGEAAGFAPGIKGVMDIAGTESALALYEIRDVEFLYITRIPESVLVKSELWAVRDKFQQREAGGATFYLRTDPASKRTVAFAFTRGYLLLATRDDLVAESLQLLAGSSNPSVAGDRWYRESTSAAGAAGELRLVMNLDSMVKSSYFRSYWVQRNAPEIRRYWSGVADMQRTNDGIIERRRFLRAADVAGIPPDATSVAPLLALVPPEAGLYRAETPESTSAAATLLVEKLMGPQPQRTNDGRIAPWAVSPDVRAGSEAELETRIDEQPLKADPGIADAIAATNAMLAPAGRVTALLVQSSAPAGGPFVRTPAAIVLRAASEWNLTTARASLSDAAGKLWSTGGLGARWTNGTAGAHTVERLDGLGTLLIAERGRLLFVANDAALLAAVLDRAATMPTQDTVTYAAGFRHARERANFERMMQALDFGTPSRGDAVPFFSGNIASLSRVLSGISEVRITRTDSAAARVETVTYR